MKIPIIDLLQVDPVLIVCSNVLAGKYNFFRVAFKCPCGVESCPPVGDLHALGYFPCSKDMKQAVTFAHVSVFRDWRNKLLCNPGGSFMGYVKELNARSKEHACVSSATAFATMHAC
jgi:hypothetical protein